MNMEGRQCVSHYKTSGTTEPQAENLMLGEIAVSTNDDNPRLFIKKNNGDIAQFVDKDYVDSSKTDNLILTSPDGSNWKISVSNNGKLSATKIK